MKDKHVFIDQGGELYYNHDILNLFTNHHYQVHPTGTNSSHQNRPVKRSRRLIGEHVCALLIGANLDIKFWSYEFYHYLCFQNAMTMNGQSSSCIFQATGKKENFLDSELLAAALGFVLLPNAKLSLSIILSKKSFLVSFLAL